MKLPVYFPGARTYALTITGLSVALLLILARPDTAGAVNEAKLLLELLAPFPLAVVGAGLLLSDPAVTLLAASPVRLERLVLARWVLAASITLLLPVAVHLLIAWTVPSGSLSLLSWLAPTVFLGTLAVAAAAIGMSRTVGTVVAIAYWGASLLLAPVISPLCAGVLDAVCGPMIWSTAYGLVAAEGAGWVANKVFLLVGTAVLASAGAMAYRDQQRLLRSATSEPIS